MHGTIQRLTDATRRAPARAVVASSKGTGWAFAVALAWVVVAGCAHGPGSAGSAGSADAAGEEQAWRAWQERRHQSLAGTNGWLTLVARHWLAEGRTPAGSAASNLLRLPAGRSPGSLGTFIRDGLSVRFEPAPGAVVTLDGTPLKGGVVSLQTDAHPPGSRLQAGELSLVVIERGDRVAVRVRDPESPARRGFEGLRWFARDPRWRVEGRFEARAGSRVLRVADVSGGIQELPSPGDLVFRHDGREWRLAVVEEPGDPEFFLMFRDATAGRSTYANGRFLSVPKPDATGRVVLDFNRAYTPPCGFTPFATCPLPPPGNILPFPIEAGERKPRAVPHP
jgi:uncharacterized protein (DUF1684 family)